MEQQELTQKKKKVTDPSCYIRPYTYCRGYFAYTKISFALSHETTDNAQVETMITPVLPRVSGYVKQWL